MSHETFNFNLMKLLTSKHFPLEPPRKKVKLGMLLKLLKKLGVEIEEETAFFELCQMKGTGVVNTNPKIIMKDEIDTAEFEIWLTPLGRTELVRQLEEQKASEEA